MAIAIKGASIWRFSGAEISILVTGGTMGILAKAIYNNVSITNCHVVNSSLKARQALVVEY
ncbi:MAG: hypothetical protein J5954_10550 [Prevotella sp.]|nr:hypothetical protein [Prevotella sp.]